MIPNPGPNKPAQDAVVVERSPFVRMAFISAAARLPGGLFLHEDLPKAVAGVRAGRAGTLFVSRAVLLDAPPDALMDLAGAMAVTGVRTVVLLTRHDPRDVGGRLAAPIQWFLTTPFPPDVMVSLASGFEPVDEGVFRAPGATLSVPNIVVPALAQTKRTSTASLPALPWPPSSAATPSPSSPSLASSSSPSQTSMPTLPAQPGATGQPVSNSAMRTINPLHAELRADRLMRTNVDRLNHFEVLGVTPDATKRDLLSAYLALVRRFHPDLAASLQDPRLAAEVAHVYRRVTEAWTVVGRDDSLQAYRMQLLASGGATAGGQPNVQTRR